MARPQRKTNKKNIVILCEGTETEVRFFKDLRDHVNKHAPDRFSEIKIIPIPLDNTPVNPRNSRRKSRQLQPSSTSFRYYIKEESSLMTYNRYKAQPTRYVREVQLFMEEDGYVEGWAVFDKDTFTHHAEAFDLAASINGLHIAFSSYCFEEWILTHFERNPHPFTTSVCKNSDKKDKGCGTGLLDDCHGNICIGGRIRECKYIPDYAKNKESIFIKYTLPRLEQCYANAAWIRTLSTEQLYNRNPYTDVDRLVKRLLDEDKEYFWHELDYIFDFSQSKIIVNYDNGHLKIENNGRMSVVLNGCTLCNSNFQKQRELDVGYIEAESHKKIPLSLSDNEVLLRLSDGKNIHYVSLG